MKTEESARAGKSYSCKTVGKTIWQALLLNGDFYENACNNPENRKIAIAIVSVAAVSHIVGSAVILLLKRANIFVLAIALVLDGLSVVGGFYFWTFSIWQLGKWLKHDVLKYEDLLTPIGFAYAPQLLNFLTVIPLLGRPIELGLAVWSLLTATVAVRQGLDISTRRAAAICIIGWPLIQIAIGLVQLLEQKFAELGA